MPVRATRTRLAALPSAPWQLRKPQGARTTRYAARPRGARAVHGAAPTPLVGGTRAAVRAQYVGLAFGSDPSGRTRAVSRSHLRVAAVLVL